MLRLSNLEGIEALLLKVPGLVQLIEDRDPRFVEELKKWLFEAERTLTSNRLSAAAEVAACRGTLISAERGRVDGEASRGRTGARRLREARAASLLKQAADVVNSAIKMRRGQAEEAERIMLQIVAVAYRIGLIPAESVGNHTSYLQTTWQTISTRPELASLVVHILGLLGSTDALIMLDRALAQYSAP